MTPTQFTSCIQVLSQDPADFVVRALIHAADVLQATEYKEGGQLIINKLYEIQEAQK